MRKPGLEHEDLNFLMLGADAVRKLNEDYMYLITHQGVAKKSSFG